MRTRKLLLSCFTVFFVIPASAKRGPQAVDEPIRSDLNSVLSVANELHDALFQKNFTAIESSLGKLLGIVIRLEQQLQDGTGVSHLLQVMQSLRGDLIEVNQVPQEQKDQPLRSVFSNVVQIARNYQLNQYRLFFCSKDKSVWLQKDWKAKNPFSPETNGNCGSLIR